MFWSIRCAGYLEFSLNFEKQRHYTFCLNWHWLYSTYIYIYTTQNRTLKPAGKWRCVIERIVLGVLKDGSAFIVTVKQSKMCSSAWPWKWSHYSPSKCLEPLTQWHSVTSQKIWIFSNTTVRTSNIATQNSSCWYVYLYVPFHSSVCIPKPFPRFSEIFFHCRSSTFRLLYE
jgi:hypothetical protein